MFDATDILAFFTPDLANKSPTGTLLPKSVGEYYSHYQSKNKSESLDILNLINICKRLSNAGYLIYSSADPRKSPGVSDSYYCLNFDKKLASYNTYNFELYGFPYIRNHFTSSVLPIVIKYDDGRHDIGSCFFIGPNLLATARHCLPQQALIQIGTSALPVASVTSPKDDNIDLAIIGLEDGISHCIKPFEIGHGDILDEVLALGYPPIPGFDALQFADTMHITAGINSTTGRITAAGLSYLDNHELLLINARVKGGNSGGPIINKGGFVVGIVTQLPQLGDKIDTMGYGVATPAEALSKVINDESLVVKQRITIKDKGFRMS